MRLEHLIDELAARRRIPPPEASEAWVLTIDGALVVRIEPRTPTSAVVSATIGPLPAERDAGDILDRLMRLQLARAADHPEILTVDPAGATLIQIMPLDVERLDVSAFEDALAGFADTLEFWRGRLERSPTKPPLMMTMLFP